MSKKLNITLILSCILCISPSILSIFFYKDLPELIPIHFKFNGEPDLYKSKFFVCFIFPIIFCFFNIFLNIILHKDSNKKHQNSTMLNIIKFIIPSICLISISTSILKSLGFNIKIELIFPTIISIIFILIGNYLPKCKQNYTIGIRLPWTLKDRDNWVKTHRFSGFLWVLSGIIMIIVTFLYKNILPYFMILLISFSLILTMMYSFFIYKKIKEPKIY